MSIGSCWAGLTADAKAKMAAVNDDATQREESMAEFMATWNAHAVDGKLSRDGFVAFKFADRRPPSFDDFDDPLRFAPVVVGGGGARAKKKKKRRKK